MKRLAQFSFFITLALAQVHCANSIDPQEPCGFVQNGEGQRVSWKNFKPIVMYIDSSVPSSYYQSIQNAISTWSRAVGYPLFQVAGQVPASAVARDDRNVIYWVYNWSSNQPVQEQANTTVYWTGNQMVEADIRVNAQGHRFSTTATAGEVDFESLMVHELGHVAGLKHGDAVESVMATYLPSGFARRSLFVEDLKNIKCEY